MILFAPTEIRNYPTDENIISKRYRQAKCDVLIETPFVKEKYSNIEFPDIMRKLIDEVFPRLIPENITRFPRDTVIELLQQHVQEMMDSISLSDNDIASMIKGLAE
jgi:hypothetical protein